jgi:hypothetical protein
MGDLGHVWFRPDFGTHHFGNKPQNAFREFVRHKLEKVQKKNDKKGPYVIFVQESPYKVLYVYWSANLSKNSYMPPPGNH